MVLNIPHSPDSWEGEKVPDRPEPKIQFIHINRVAVVLIPQVRLVVREVKKSDLKMPGEADDENRRTD